METRFEVDTSLGPIWFWGRDTGRPVLLMISGAFAAADYLERIQIVHPAVDALRVHLPGNHCPALRETSLRATVAALDEALARRWAFRPTAVLGVSTGGLVALGLRARQVRQLVVIEPPLHTAGVWPLEDLKSQAPPGQEAFLSSFFGLADGCTEVVDHTWTLEGLATPTVAILGGEPLQPQRPLPHMPSLVNDVAALALARAPAVRIEWARSAGHNVPRDAPEVMHRWVVDAVARVVAQAGQAGSAA